jgi:NhaP-type Na+/H+ or K+/H+ antiporter
MYGDNTWISCSVVGTLVSASKWILGFLLGMILCPFDPLFLFGAMTVLLVFAVIATYLKLESREPRYLKGQ